MPCDDREAGRQQSEPKCGHPILCLVCQKKISVQTFIVDHGKQIVAATFCYKGMLHLLNFFAKMLLLELPCRKNKDVTEKESILKNETCP